MPKKPYIVDLTSEQRARNPPGDWRAGRRGLNEERIGAPRIDNPLDSSSAAAISSRTQVSSSTPSLPRSDCRAASVPMRPSAHAALAATDARHGHARVCARLRQRAERQAWKATGGVTHVIEEAPSR